jgi:excisionase family DNA binding protein
MPELVGPDGRERIKLPQVIYDVLKEVVRNLNQGRSVSVVLDSADLTTQRAANILGVSRPHLIKLLEQNAIPFHRIGTHRRIQYRDLVAYARKRDAARKLVLDQLARDEFRDGMYDNLSLPDDAEDE